MPLKKQFLLLSTVVHLIFLGETVIHFSFFFINRKFKRTAFVTIDKLNTSSLNKSITFFQKQTSKNLLIANFWRVVYLYFTITSYESVGAVLALTQSAFSPHMTFNSLDLSMRTTWPAMTHPNAVTAAKAPMCRNGPVNYNSKNRITCQERSQDIGQYAYEVDPTCREIMTMSHSSCQKSSMNTTPVMVVSRMARTTICRKYNLF